MKPTPHFLLPEIPIRAQKFSEAPNRFPQCKTSASPDDTPALERPKLGTRFIELLAKNLKAASQRSRQLQLAEAMVHSATDDQSFRLPVILKQVGGHQNNEALTRLPKKVASLFEPSKPMKRPECKSETDRLNFKSLKALPKNLMALETPRDCQEHFKQGAWSCRNITASKVYKSLRDVKPETLPGNDGLMDEPRDPNETSTMVSKLNSNSLRAKLKLDIQSIFKKQLKKEITPTPLKEVPSALYQTPNGLKNSNSQNLKTNPLKNQVGFIKVNLLDTTRRVLESNPNYNALKKTPRGVNFCDFYLSENNRDTKCSYPSNRSTTTLKPSHLHDHHLESKNPDHTKIPKPDVKSKIISAIKTKARQGSIMNLAEGQWSINVRRTMTPRTQPSIYDLTRRLRSVNLSASNLPSDRNQRAGLLGQNFNFLNPHPGIRNIKKSLVISGEESIWSQMIKQLLDKPKISASTLIYYYEVLGINCGNPNNANDQVGVCSAIFEKVKSDIVSELKFNFMFRPLVADHVFGVSPGSLLV
jgi:hypothetical protein